MARVEDLLVRIEANTLSLRREMTRAERSVATGQQRINSSLKRIDAGLSGGVAALGRFAASFGAVFGVLGAASLGRSFVQAAQDAEELQSAFNFSFGAMARDVDAWARETGDALGRSTRALQEQAFTFNQLFKAAAPTAEQAAELSKQFTLLANDLSSFFNVTESDALQKLRAGLVGEAEPLRTFGVFLNAAAVEAKGLELGLADANGELSEQAKILARAAIIMEATVDAQGDLSRTADSATNQQRRLRAEWEELSIVIGRDLLPLLTPLIAQLAEAAKLGAEAFGGDGGFLPDNLGDEFNAALERVTALRDRLNELEDAAAQAKAAGRDIVGPLNQRLVVVRDQLAAAEADAMRLQQAMLALDRGGTRGAPGEPAAPPAPAVAPRARGDLKEQTDELGRFMAALREEGELLRLTTAEREVETAVRRAQALAMEQGTLLTTEQIAAIREEVAAQQLLRQAREELSDGLAREQALMDEGRALKEQLATAEERHAASLARVTELLRQGAIDQETYSRAVAAANAELERADTATRDVARTLDGVLNQALNGSIDSWQDLLRVALSAIQQISDALLEADQRSRGGGLFSALLTAGSAVFSAAFGVAGSDIGVGNTTGAGGAGVSFTHFGGPRQHGGPVSPGTAYLVGERGPEIFVPNAPGRVAAGGAGAGVTLVQHFTVNGSLTERERANMLALSRQTARGAVAELEREVDAGGTRAKVFGRRGR